MINTTNSLFIVGGAFPELEEHVKGHTHDELLAKLKPEDRQKFDLIPEFVGRFPVVTFPYEPDAEALTRIAELSCARGTGVRGLRSIMASVLRKSMYS